ncbi:MAG: hypothetical protein KGD63_06610 [Candidatus Lokiarchaeota archaeon]|nr:hypothetical protein [Candidatus Lokiarchaeota archaeon]
MTDGIFIIRGGFFGWEFTLKLLYIIFGLILCIYDWKKNKRKDYFWVFLFGTMLYIGSEIMLYFFGGRVMQENFLFNMNITSMPWLWIPMLAVGDVVMLAVIALFFADRIRNSETRKKWGILFIIWVFCRDGLPYIILFSLGYKFNTISIGDPLIYSRRNMIEIGTIMALSIFIGITIIWLVKTDKKSRKRGLYMIGVMIILMTAWSLGEWFSGQRWIEVGPEEGPWTIAPPLLQFMMFAYDIVIEMGLFTLCFLAVPYFLKLIKSEKQD